MAGRAASETQGDRVAIQNAVAAHMVASNRGGAEGAKGYASFAMDDARWLPPGAPAIAGRHAMAIDKGNLAVLDELVATDTSTTDRVGRCAASGASRD